MRTFTHSELEKMPHCLYTLFGKCTVENLPMDVDKRRRRCLFCALDGLGEALIKDVPAGAQACFDAAITILKDMNLLEIPKP
jgi:hypothetical protein